MYNYHYESAELNKFLLLIFLNILPRFFKKLPIKTSFMRVKSHHFINGYILPIAY
jgi:hypothetical protein